MIVCREQARAAHPMAPPYVVKPNNEGSSVGVYLVHEGANGPAQLVRRHARDGAGRGVCRRARADDDGDGRPGARRHRHPRRGLVRLSRQVRAGRLAARGSGGAAGGDHRRPASTMRCGRTRRSAAAASAAPTSAGTSARGLDGLVLLEINTQPGMTPTSLAPEQAALLRHLLRRAGALDGGGRVMLPVKAPRRDPAPSRLRYKLNRLWLRPGFRRLVNFGVPMLAGVAAAWTLSAEYDLRGRGAGAGRAGARGDRRPAAVHHHRARRARRQPRPRRGDPGRGLRAAAGLEPRARRRRGARPDRGARRGRARAGAGAGQRRAGDPGDRAGAGGGLAVGRRARAARPERRAGRRGRQPAAPARPAADRRRRRRRARARGAGAARRGAAGRRRGFAGWCGSASGAGTSCSTATR